MDAARRCLIALSNRTRSLSIHLSIDAEQNRNGETDEVFKGLGARLAHSDGGRLRLDQNDQQLEASGDRAPAVPERTAEDAEPRLEVAHCQYDDLDASAGTDVRRLVVVRKRPAQQGFIEIVRADVRAEKVAVLTDATVLEDGDSERFWPI